MTNIRTLYLHAAAIILAATLAGCATRYELTGVTRTRVLIDSRFDTPRQADAEAFVAPYKHKVDSMMNPVAGQTARYMTADRPESLLSNLMADILLWDAQRYGDPADMAVYNMGGIRAALPEGNVTLGDLLEVAPFENKLCIVSLGGDKLQELFSQIAASGGEAVSHGVEMTITRSGRLVKATLNGRPIDPEKTYRIATIDFVAQGNDGMTAFKNSTRMNMPQPEGMSIRADIAEYFRQLAAQGKAADSRIEGRIKIVEE